MSIVRFLLPLALALTTCWANNPIFENVDPQPFDNVPQDYRLPSNVVPTNYKINLETHLTESDEKIKYKFEGESKISINIQKKTDSIRLHTKELEFKDIKLICKSDDPDKEEENIEIKNHEKDEKRNFLTIFLKNEITPKMKDCILEITYSGILNDKLRGFFRSSYQNERNTIYIAATHFEPTSARMAFPCWDEPAIKATFEITIKHSADYKAVISNMDSEGSEDGNKLVTKFKPTPKMSTYLVAFLVSNYDKKSNKDDTFNIWTRPQVVQSATFALEYGQSIMEELEDFTGIKYKSKEGQKMSKMDQVTIPQFATGAMENWGLVMYREPVLLYTENVTTTQRKQGIVTIMSHEFSHQWFGNLVSPKWWKYIWLNEGFATFFQYYTAEKIMTDKKEAWRLMDQFIVKILQESAFVTDAKVQNRPMNYDAATPDQILSLFDNIAYKKAASVIYMMQNFLTEEVFKDGLRNYLKKHKFDSVDSDDLFGAVHEIASKKNVLPEDKTLKEIMANWVDKAGYPVVSVTRDNKTGDATLDQERFYLVKPEKKDNTHWWVPITYVTEESPEIKETKPKVWLQPHKALKVSNLNESQWVLFNNYQTGYYRVNYDDTNWERLAKQLNMDKFDEKIKPVSRAQLIDDALNLARADLLSYEVALPITLYLSRETDYIPWYAAIRALDYLDRVLQGAKEHETYHKYVAQKIKAFVDAVKFEESEKDTHLTKLARELILTTACKYEQEDCKKFAEQKLGLWLNDKEKNNLSTDLRRGIFCGGLRNADEKTWEKALESYKKSEDKVEKQALRDGLGCAKSEKIVNKFLDLTLQEKPDFSIFEVLNSIHAGNPASFDIVINFAHKNIKKVRAEDNEKNEKLTALLNKLSNSVTTLEQYGKLALFTQKQQLRGQKFQALTTAMENLDWIESHIDEVAKWVKDTYKEEKKNSAGTLTFSTFLIIVPVLIARFY